MGPVVGTFAMELAMKKAKQTGIGYVTASNSSHFAATGYYPMMAAQKGFVGYTCTCGSPSIAPWGGVKALASNTPFAISFPYSKFPIVLDMAFPQWPSRRFAHICAKAGSCLTAGPWTRTATRRTTLLKDTMAS